ncbi:MAG: Ig-like domain-containing protein, partial [Verrucomicrobiota bacterium]
MRYSNTEYIDFGQQIKGLSRQPLLGAGSRNNSGAGGVQTPPVAVDDLAVSGDCEPVIIDLLGNDYDGEGDSFSLARINGQLPTIGQPISLPDGGTVTLLADGSVEFSPGSDFKYLDEGETSVVSFSYTIVDENGNESTAQASVTVEGSDQIGDTQPDFDEVFEGDTVCIDVLANDSDPDTSDSLSVGSLVSQPVSGLATTDGDKVFFDPGTDFEFLAVGETATVTFTYSAETPDGDTLIETVTVTVHGTNDIPSASDDSATTTENTPIVIDPLANDSDPDFSDNLQICGVEINGAMVALTLGVPVYLDSGACLTLLTDGTVEYKPAGDTNALNNGESVVDEFVYKIEDGNGGTATATVYVTILGEDDPTDSNPDDATTTENSTVCIDVLANDSDPDISDNPLIVSQMVEPMDGGSISTDGSKIIFDPGTDFENLGSGESATVTFTYTAETPDGETVIETVTVTVNGENDIPVATDDFATTSETTPVNIAVLSNDSDSDSSDLLNVCGIVDASGTMVIPTPGVPVTLSSGGSAVLFADGTFDYQAPSSVIGLDDGESFFDSFIYKIDDGNGGTATATVDLVVEDDGGGVLNPVIGTNRSERLVGTDG